MKLDYLIDTNILILLFNDELAEPIPNRSLGYYLSFAQINDNML